MKDWTTAKLLDVANLILGAALFLSPWTFDTASGPASINSWIIGFAIAALAIDAIAAFARWEEWLNLALGLWTAAAPFVLGFQGTTAMTVHLIIGVLVAALAALELWMTQRRPKRQTATRLAADTLPRHRPKHAAAAASRIAPTSSP